MNIYVIANDFSAPIDDANALFQTAASTQWLPQNVVEAQLCQVVIVSCRRRAVKQPINQSTCFCPKTSLGKLS